MADKVKVTFYLDPICPFSYRTFLWIREARQYRPLEIDWRFLSLQAINEGTDRVKEAHAHSIPAFRVMAKGRLDWGNDAVEKLYASIGHMRHVDRENIANHDILIKAAQEAGIDPAVVDRALDDPVTMEVLQDDHTSGVVKGAFGVASIEVNEDKRAFFGPVLSEVVTGERAGELWDHFAWMIAQPEFFEIKRERH